ncbi:Arm DNA-binding domain-containing protein [Vibrio metoecus]|uniref:Arm DNA-binding domain-containing protein n=1 Tax=Vibrio metoecus TaxID=1481663 RepID=UPI001071A50C
MESVEPKTKPLNLPTGVELNGNLLRIVFYYQGKRYRESFGLSSYKTKYQFCQAKAGSDSI